MTRTPIDGRLSLAVAAMLVMWASAFAAIRGALPFFSPGALALLRFLFASATLGALSLARGLPRPRRRDLPILLGLGLLGITIYHLCLNWGQQTVTAGAASLLIASAPMVTALLARLLLKEALGRWAWAGIVLGFGGIALITLGEGQELRVEPGALVILLAAVSASLYSVLQKKHVGRYPPLVFTTYVVWAGTIPMLVFLPHLMKALQTAPPAAIASVAYLGAFPGGLAYVLWVYGLSRTTASRLSSFLYLSPVLAIGIAWVWLREIPSWLSLAGGAVTIAGVALANVRRGSVVRPSA
ncbi:MAG: Permease of the drug/metabolite transporter (DMT) superfamily [Candidatus Bipolaricaulis sibiricus]|uniref:Permease of the drug/metabolite transporter (DMT) superfamily n=1 Tax=Bipolaricaulis sibiricus TaxID=2501609 RepID=A0A410FSR9_BIPS1|nr:MAG: Permease of the drug/metabolite transporter (DMT) superfamily [Candidatus Bipolaricaulis sibiricus]